MSGKAARHRAAAHGLESAVPLSVQGDYHLTALDANGPRLLVAAEANHPAEVIDGRAAS